MIRIVCDDRDKPIKLDFGNFPDRDSVRDVLNRLRGDDSNPASAPGAKARAMPRSKPQPRANRLTAAQLQWRQKILGYPEVQRLHAGLVVQSGAVTDEEFFEGMKYKFKPNGDRRNNGANASSSSHEAVGKVKGIPSHAFNAPKSAEIPKDKKKKEGLEPDNWPEDGIPVPAQRHRIFLLIPVAARAYADLIGKKSMPEKKFWDTLKESSLVNKLSTDLRFRRNATATKADAVFAEYFSSNQMETRNEDKEREKNLDKSLDIRRFDDHRSSHVLEGHPAFGDAPKITNTPGISQPASSHLRIMREVNRHGRMIMDDSTFKKREGWRKSAAERKGVFLDDLAEKEQPKFATLSETTVQKAAAQFQSKITNEKKNINAAPVGNDNDTMKDAALMRDIETVENSMIHWTHNPNPTLHTRSNGGAVLLKLLGQMRP